MLSGKICMIYFERKRTRARDSSSCLIIAVSFFHTILFFFSVAAMLCSLFGDHFPFPETYQKQNRKTGTDDDRDKTKNKGCIDPFFARLSKAGKLGTLSIEEGLVDPPTPFRLFILYIPLHLHWTRTIRNEIPFYLFLLSRLVFPSHPSFPSDFHTRVPSRRWRAVRIESGQRTEHWLND